VQDVHQEEWDANTPEGRPEIIREGGRAKKGRGERERGREEKRIVTVATSGVS
jgi:hypothetical protein